MNNPYYNQYCLPYCQPIYNPQQNMTQADAPNRFDFVGRYVTSYEEVKSAPFNEQTCIYLDTTNDRVYIKELTKDGVPSISVLGLVDVQAPKESAQETKEDTSLEKIMNELQTLTKRVNEIDNKLIQSKF